MRKARRRENARRGASQCLACGLCCELYGDTLAAEEADLERWRREGRSDLLSRVGEGGALWSDPTTREPLAACPFLLHTDLDRALCVIHDTKPGMCRAYPGDGHGSCCAAGHPFDVER